MDKKKYETPEIEIIRFETEDVIVTSCPTDTIGGDGGDETGLVK